MPNSTSLSLSGTSMWESNLGATNKQGPWWQPDMRQLCSSPLCLSSPPPVSQLSLWFRCSVSRRWMVSCVGATEWLQNALSRLSSANAAPAVRGTRHIGGCDSGRRTRWITLSSSVLNGWGCSVAPSPPCVFSQSEPIPLENLFQENG